MLVLGKGVFYSHSVNANIPDDINNQYRVYCKSDNPLQEFKWNITESLSRFHRMPLNYTPALDTYSKEIKIEVFLPRASGTSILFGLGEIIKRK